MESVKWWAVRLRHSRCSPNSLPCACRAACDAFFVFFYLGCKGMVVWAMFQSSAAGEGDPGRAHLGLRGHKAPIWGSDGGERVLLTAVLKARVRFPERRGQNAPIWGPGGRIPTNPEPENWTGPLWEVASNRAGSRVGDLCALRFDAPSALIDVRVPAQLALPTCHVRYHTELWDSRSTGLL